MNTILRIALILLSLQTYSYAQLSFSAAVTPRIEKEDYEAVMSYTKRKWKVNTYGTINSTYKKNDFYINLGLGILYNESRSFTERGTIHYSGGSGELQTQNIYRFHRFKYTYMQSTLAFGKVIDNEKVDFFIGLGTQADFLLNFKLRDDQGEFNTVNTSFIDNRRRSIYVQFNPRWKFQNERFFLQLNNSIGYSFNRKSHIRRIDSYASPDGILLGTLFFESGVALGFAF